MPSLRSRFAQLQRQPGQRKAPQPQPPAVAAGDKPDAEHKEECGRDLVGQHGVQRQRKGEQRHASRLAACAARSPTQPRAMR